MMLRYSDLRKSQKQCIEYTTDGNETLILADVGTGKTVMALSTILNWIRDGLAKRVLILAPKRVCTDVWIQELDEWDFLNTGILTVANCAGLKADKRKAVIEDLSINVVLLNYESWLWYAENYPKTLFDTLICDEIDKCKDRTSKRFKGSKKILESKRSKSGKKILRIHGLKRYRQQFTSVIGMTGTPASNSLMDIWAQAFLVDGGEALGTSFSNFQQEFFYAEDFARRNWQLKHGAETEIFARLASISFRIERDAEISGIVELPPRYCTLPASLKKIYNRFKREFLAHLESGEPIESPNAAAAYGKLRQLAGGVVYIDPDTGEISDKTTKEYRVVHPGKFELLDDLRSELQGKQLITVYHFKAQALELKRRYPNMRILGGGISDKTASEIIRQWNAGEFKDLALQPASAGHGLNLQKSSAHHMVMLNMPESAGLVEQVIGRLRRTGNSAKNVFIHRLLCKDSIDIIQDMKVRKKIVNQAHYLAEFKKLTM